MDNAPTEVEWFTFHHFNVSLKSCLVLKCVFKCTHRFLHSVSCTLGPIKKSNPRYIRVRDVRANASKRNVTRMFVRRI